MASAGLVRAEPVFSEPEQLALAEFLARYSGLTRDAYMLDLRQFTMWCHQHGLHLFAARRADIESFARDLEAKGRARSTVSRRLATIAGLYRYAVDPARRPALDDARTGRSVLPRSRLDGRPEPGPPAGRRLPTSRRTGSRQPGSYGDTRVHPLVVAAHAG